MTKIKICGLTTSSAIQQAVVCGADYLGFVFAESPRRISPEEVRKLTESVPKSVKKVGVFVSPSVTEVEETIKIAGLDLVQIHGKPLEAGVSVPVIQAVDPQSAEEPSVEESDFLLMDAPPSRYMGGNGKVFDWQSVDTSKLVKEKLWIAGGLDADNVKEAIRYFHPYAVDVSSGVETNGKKDLTKIAAFCQAVKEENHVSTTK